MGREFDGSYAQYTCVPVSSVFPVETDLSWETLGALPEMLQTCHGSLHTGLGVESGDTLLIRGGTSSVGLSTLAMAKIAGLRVLSTSRTAAKTEVLRVRWAWMGDWGCESPAGPVGGNRESEV